MKLFSIVFLITFLIVNGAHGQQLSKLAGNETDAEMIKFTESFAIEFLTTLKNNGVYNFTGKATEVLETQMNANNQKLTYAQLKASFGDFVSLKYAQAWKMNDGTRELTIYRMQAVFSASVTPVEFRVVLDDTGKIAGIWAAPWKETL